MNSSLHRCTRIDWLIAGGVLVLALTLRLLYLSSTTDRAWPHSILYEGDAPEWVNYAASLDRGVPYEFGLPMRSPAVAHLIHWLAPGLASRALSSTGTESFVSLKMMWCAISAMTCALAYVAFVKQAGRRIALIGAGLCTFSFASYITATSLNNDALYACLLILIMMGWMQRVTAAINLTALLIALAIGLLHGVAMLTRQEHVLFFLMMMAWGTLRPTCAQRASDSAVTDTTFASRRMLWNGIVLQALVIVGAFVAVCLPRSIAGSRAIERFNTMTTETPDFQRAKIRWTSEAQARINALPAFARNGNFMFMDSQFASQQKQVVESEDVDRFFAQQFGYTPKPISKWVFVSMKGPLDFALANHPAAHGQFSKAALVRSAEDRDPALMLGRPDHLRLINEGYSVGVRYITADLTGWIRNVGAKVFNFFAGVTLGFSANNLPIGLHGVRRPVDLMTAASGDALLWRAVVFALIGLGVISSVQQRMGAVWFILITYKLVVTALFYGYARQAVSILPAFYFFAALGIDQAAQWVTPYLRLESHRLWRRGVVIVIAGALLALVISDASAALRPRRLNVTGSKWETPALGPGAFRSFDTLRIDATVGGK